MVRIPVVVSEKQKERWTSFAENEPSLDSVSDLVRTSVERFIADGDSGSSELNPEVVDEILSSLDRLDRDIGKLETHIKALRSENIEADEMEILVRDEVENIIGRLDSYAPELFESTANTGER